MDRHVHKHARGPARIPGRNMIREPVPKQGCSNGSLPQNQNQRKGTWPEIRREPAPVSEEREPGPKEGETGN